MKPLPLLSIAALLATGCASPVLPPAKRSLSVSTAAVTHLANVTSRPVTAIEPSQLPAFIYPPDATNYIWTLQSSRDLLHWRDVITFARMTNAASGYYSVSNEAPMMFYRMKGTP